MYVQMVPCISCCAKKEKEKNKIKSLPSSKNWLFILTGQDSPVSADWSTSTMPSFIRQSAGTVEPAAILTRSPAVRVRKRCKKKV